MTTRIWPTIAAAIDHAPQRVSYPMSWDPARHLLSRFAFGPTPESVTRVRAHGVGAWYAEQLRWARRHSGYEALPAMAAVGPLLTLTPPQVYRSLSAKGHAHQGDAMNQLGLVTLGLQAYSPAQLYETLVDFFSNHLNVANHSTAVWATRADYDRTVIRAHVTGSFSDMLLASAKHPAMLAYLNLAESTKAAINENYGRELLELHTVGRTYTEADVRNTAKLLTGRTWSEGFVYTYRQSLHATGPVAVKCFHDANARASLGERAGDNLVRYLAHHPDTARNLARQICIRYVSDSPSQALVNAVANAYLRTNTEILPMVDTILRSDEFWAARGAKLRRPNENIVATVRLLDLPVTHWGTALLTLKQHVTPCGNMPLEAPYPPGYADVAGAWRSSANLLNLWNAQQALAVGYASGFGRISPAQLYGGHAPTTSGAAVAMIAHRLLGEHPGQHTVDTVQQFLGEPESTPMSRSRVRGLVRQVAILILHSPQHALR